MTKLVKKLWEFDPATTVKVTVREVEGWVSPPWWEDWRDAGD